MLLGASTAACSGLSYKATNTALYCCWLESTQSRACDGSAMHRDKSMLVIKLSRACEGIGMLKDESMLKVQVSCL